ncbi:MAG: VOC family protein [Candidatus Berkelbacteria bacterium]|nr:VOC family protein [Candidatus Berkelbacteria bacterium]
MKINHITLLVSDKEKAINFYTKILELGSVKIVNQKHSWINFGGSYLHITDNSGTPIKDSFYHFALEVENIDDYIEKIRKNGAEVDDSNNQFFVRDPDGNLIEFIDSNNSFFK